MPTKAALAPAPMWKPPLALVIDAIMFIIRAILGSILGISTASIFAIFALVVMADVPPDLAITSVALGMNGMLLSLMALGAMMPDDEEP